MMKHIHELTLQAIPLGATITAGIISSIDPSVFNPWMAMGVSFLAGLYYLKMLFKKDKK